MLSRQGLGGKAQLVVVEVEGTRYVLGVTEQGVSVVDRTRAPQPIGAAPAARTETTDVVSEFERLLAESTPDRSPDAPVLRRDRRPRSGGSSDALHGSILSPGTWRQTAQALRRTR